MLEDVGGSYEEHLAESYDDMFLQTFAMDTAGAVAFMRSAAGDGPVLELGIGTGRVAIPLHESGTTVHGIDSSEHMVKILRAKPGGAELPVTIADMASFDLNMRFPVIYAVFNTFFSLLTQDAQVSCFQRVADHLEPGGVFVMQAFVPDAGRFDLRNQGVSIESTSPQHLEVDAATHDPVAQRVDNVHVVVQDGTVQLFPVKIRYAYVSELDLMARMAGLELRERMSDWDRSAFPGPNGIHISVWGNGDPEASPRAT